MTERIAVIGGGLSGLSTAFYLKQVLPQANISLFENASRLGGVIYTEQIETSDGLFVIDHGADMFATEPPAAMELCRELGVDDQLILPDTDRAGAMIVFRGRLIPIPDGFVLMRATKLWQMVTTPLLSLRGKLRFLAERFIRPSTSQTSSVDVDQSVAEFVRHRMGSETLDRLVGPLVAGIYTADVEKLSMNATMAPMLKMVRDHGSLAKATLARAKAGKDSTERNSAGARYEKFRGFPNGMQQLIDSLAAAIGTQAIHLETPVTRLQPSGTDAVPWRLESNGQSLGDFDWIVFATPANVTAKLLRAMKPKMEPAKILPVENSDLENSDFAAAIQTAADGLETISYASTAIAVLCVRQSQIERLPRQFGFVVPRNENRKILAVSFASHKYARRCPADHTIIRVFVGGATQRELLDQSDESLLAMVRGELADLIGMSGTETLARVVRWNDAMPQYHVGHVSLADEIENAVAKIPGVSLATNALRGVGIAPVIARSKDVAMAISKQAGV